MKTITFTAVLTANLMAPLTALPIDDWPQLTAVGGGAQTHVQPSHWNRDSHPAMPEITPKSKTALLDVDGPGVVTLIHVSKYQGGDQDKLILRVWYDGEKAPAIEMPWLDFLGDVEAKTAYFSTVYFSHVKESHNFRLPMPFRKHVRIEVENPTGNQFFGYTDVQWEKVKALPAHIGCLRVAYRTGALTIPAQPLEVCDIKGPGVIIAHWLQLQGDHPDTVNSGLLCEGNQELYLDSSPTPQVEYLGTEDCYGYSWGMGGGIQSDAYAAITRAERWKSGGLFAMLRCRGTDKISFEKSCRWAIDYREEYFSALSKNPRFKHEPKRSLVMPYRSAVYYYSPTP